MIKRDWVLAAMILLLTGFYYVRNYEKLVYFYKKTFVTPYTAGGDLKRSPVVRVRVGALKRSYIADAVVDAMGKSVIFVDVPRSVVSDEELSSGEGVHINEERVDVFGDEASAGDAILDDVVYFEHLNIRFYLIRDNYVETMVGLIQTNGFISTKGSI